jgi:hypothetical protein
MSKKEKKTRVLGVTVTLLEALEHIKANYEEAIRNLKDDVRPLSYNPYSRYISMAEDYWEAAKRLAEKQ